VIQSWSAPPLSRHMLVVRLLALLLFRAPALPQQHALFLKLELAASVLHLRRYAWHRKAATAVGRLRNPGRNVLLVSTAQAPTASAVHATSEKPFRCRGAVVLSDGSVLATIA